jgi:hypothetical protein
MELNSATTALMTVSTPNQPEFFAMVFVLDIALNLAAARHSAALIAGPADALC